MIASKIKMKNYFAARIFGISFLLACLKTLDEYFEVKFVGSILFYVIWMSLFLKLQNVTHVSDAAAGLVVGC